MNKIILILLLLVVTVGLGFLGYKYLYKPDLIITDVVASINQENPQDCVYNVRVKNQGLKPVKELFYFCYSYDSSNICNSGVAANLNSNGDIVAVSPGDQYSLQIYDACLPAGYKFYFKIDAPENFIDEAKENNNNFILSK